MVRKTVETTIKLEVPVADLRRALRLPKWGRLTLGNLHVKQPDGTYAKVDNAVPAFAEEADGGSVTFVSYQTKSRLRRLR